MTRKKERGQLIVLSGPSGVGKSTVIAELLGQRDNIYFSVSYTTRQPRVGEQDGVNYCFVSRGEFEGMIARNELLEYAEYVGNYYGTPKKFVVDMLSFGKDVILEIDVKGALQVKQNYPDSLLFFIEAPSEQALYERLVQRGSETPDKIQIRMARNKLELAQRSKYDYCIMNDSVDRAVKEIIDILKEKRQ